METKNNMPETIKSVFDGVSTLARTDKIVGEPYSIGDAIIVPFIETAVGFGLGEFANDKAAGGVACKVTPFACLVIQGGFTKLVDIKGNDAISKALDLIPDLINKLEGAPNISPEVKKSVRSLEPKNIIIEKKDKRVKLNNKGSNNKKSAKNKKK